MKKCLDKAVLKGIKRTCDQTDLLLIIAAPDFVLLF